MTMADIAHSGTAYDKLIQEQLDEERDRKKMLESKGSAVLTTAAALTTLLFGLAALVTGVEGYTLPSDARNVLIFAFVAFAISALLGLSATWPMKYIEARSEDLTRLTEPEYWNSPADIGERRSAELRVRVMTRARNRNRIKAWFVTAGMTLEFVAAGVLSYAIYRIFDAA